MDKPPEIFTVSVPGVRAKFEGWMRDRGGVVVWRSVDLSNLDRGDMFAPLRDPDGNESGKPHWAYAKLELVTDIARFRFVVRLEEVGRCKIALDRRLHGMTIRLTTASSNRVKKLERELNEKHGYVTRYFDDLECVFEKSVFEDEPAVAAAQAVPV